MKLRIEKIEKSYKSKKVLGSIELNIKKGEFLSILGVSGSGKSTLLRLISGLESIDQGKIYLDDKDMTHVAVEERNIGFVFQEAHLFPNMTVGENIAFSLNLKGLKKPLILEKVNRLLKRMQIEELVDRYPDQISGGQKKRVAIARALVYEPSLVLMDEPFSGLDRTLREDMGKLIKQVQEVLGLTIIFVTHDVEESLRLSDRIALLDQGEIRQVGSCWDVYRRPASKEVAKLMGEGNWIEGRIEDGLFKSILYEGNYEGPLKKQKALCFFRPEDIEILEAREAEATDFIIEKIEKLGKVMRYHVDCGQKHLLVDSLRHDFKKGQKISLSFPRGAAHIISIE